MSHRKTSVAAILMSIVCSVSVSALAPVAPPAATLAAPAQVNGLSAIASTSSQLPTQKELLQKSTASAINVAAPTASSASPSRRPTNPVSISSINYDGKVPTTEADEYVVVTNPSKDEVDVSGLCVSVATTGTQGPTFTFPRGTFLKPGQSVRIYTNEIHKETGGYSFGSGKAIWNNKGGVALLKSASGEILSEFKYKAAA